MKLLLFPILSSICLAPLSKQVVSMEKSTPASGYFAVSETLKETPVIGFQDGSNEGKMSSTVFKNQDFCRATLEDFDFDAHFSVVSATVYFSGANFKNVEKGFITSNSLKPIKELMRRCLPGSKVLFDEIKVKGPDNEIRIIQGLSLLLY
jgi:hypothetical protein